ncbi:MAG: RnfABCDGE type electron transport complex subunit B [bacterium]
MSTDLIYPIALLGGFGLVFGVVLAIAALVFAVEIDPRVEAIEKLLPGANCGGCGFPGCSGYAEAMVLAGASGSMCPAVKPAERAKIGEILGIVIEESKPMIAVVRCAGCVTTEKSKYDYMGEQDCATAVILAGGPNHCRYGCVGMGSCVKACRFDAIHLRDGQTPEVDPAKCIACGKCAGACPKSLIAIMPADRDVIVMCSSRGKGKPVKDICAVGCIACGLCSKKCPETAITIEYNLPVIDYNKCTSCGTCAEVCPQKSILFKGKKQVAIGAEK